MNKKYKNTYRFYRYNIYNNEQNIVKILFINKI